MNTKRAWIYCCIDAPEDNHGALKSQHEKLDIYSKQMEFEAVGSSHELATTQDITRPGLLEISTAAWLKRIDVLLVESLSRISRDESKALEFIRDLNIYGIIVYSPLEGEINQDRDYIQCPTQEAYEVKYKVALRLLDKMLRNRLISSDEHKKIDLLNRKTFSPEFSKVYE